MKQKIYILGLVTTLIILCGALFKLEHWPGAAHLITLGMITLVLLFLPVALRNNYRTEGHSKNKILYFITWLTCFVIFIAMLFKILHWPFAGYLLLIALPFPYVVFLPVFLVVTSKDKNFNIYNTVFVLFLLSVFSVFSVLLALNVSKEMINDSLGLSKNYNKLELALDKTTDTGEMIPVVNNINDVLNIIDEYQSLILRFEGVTVEQWNDDPNILRKSERPQIASPALVTSENKLDTRLETSLNKLMVEIENTAGYEKLARATPAIFEFTEPFDDQYEWTAKIFQYNTQSWALIYLDGLETNLKLIKASIAAINQ